MLEALYEEKPDMFLDEAVAALQLKSTKPLNIWSVKRELDLLDMTHKLVGLGSSGSQSLLHARLLKLVQVELMILC